VRVRVTVKEEWTGERALLFDSGALTELRAIGTPHGALHVQTMPVRLMTTTSFPGRLEARARFVVWPEGRDMTYRVAAMQRSTTLGFRTRDVSDVGRLVRSLLLLSRV
jgi:ribosomal protein L34